MKKLLIIMIASLAVFACNTLTSAERAEREAKTAQAVEKALTERQYFHRCHGQKQGVYQL